MQSERLRFRRFTIADLPNMIELESNPEIVKFTPYRIPQTREQTLSRLQNVVEKDFGKMGIWAAEAIDTKDFIGWFMLMDTQLIYPELGFMVVEHQWEKGYATEGAKALVKYGLETLELRGILAITDQGNLGSKKVLGRAGFAFREQVTETDKLSGKEISLDMYEIKKPI